jgi:hypothetical protein
MPGKSGQLSTNEKRFGNISVEKGFITQQQLVEALNNQVVEETKNGKHLFIGEILLDLNYMTLEQIEEVLVALIRT